VPIVLGGGKRLFADGAAPPHSFRLTSSRGLCKWPDRLAITRREGEIKIGDTALDTPSELEIARQTRIEARKARASPTPSIR